MKWWDRMPCSSLFECWVLSQLFSLSSFTLTKRIFSSSLLSAIRVVLSAYLKLLIFLPTILIQVTCDSSSPVFLMMYSAYKLIHAGWQYTASTYTFPYFEAVCCSISSSNCWFLTCTQISQEEGQVVWYSHLFKYFHSLLWSTWSKYLAQSIKQK